MQIDGRCVTLLALSLLALSDPLPPSLPPHTHTAPPLSTPAQVVADVDFVAHAARVVRVEVAALGKALGHALDGKPASVACSAVRAASC